jgi:hypothetical protein
LITGFNTEVIWNNSESNSAESRTMAESGYKAVIDVIRRYKKKLSPGVYFFYGVWDRNKLIGIGESMEPYPQEEMKEKYGVTFGYYLRNPYKEDSKKRSKACLGNGNRFFPSIEKTPEFFQMALLKYLLEKLR